MSSKIVKQQLEKCKVADLSNFDATTNTYLVKKFVKPEFKVLSCYLVKISNEVLNNKTSVEAVNWNHGTAPVSEYAKIYVSKILGQMIYVDALGYNICTSQDTNVTWSGWLNANKLTLLKTL